MVPLVQHEQCGLEVACERMEHEVQRGTMERGFRSECLGRVGQHEQLGHGDLRELVEHLVQHVRVECEKEHKWYDHDDHLHSHHRGKGLH